MQASTISHLLSAVPGDPPLQAGEVALVGSGPGDPGLLTLRALNLISQADVVVYDRLVGAGIMALIPAQCPTIYVGKAAGDHVLPQGEINQLLVKLAQEGKRTVRLKGGDPYIFGRGGEEVEELRQAGIRYRVVPGITAASGCATYAGIPLTHRDHAQSCTLITGHLKTDGELDLNWQALAAPGQTLVFYMGIGATPLIARRLREAGLAASTPAAVIERGTTDRQRVLRSTLSQLPDLIARENIKPPALLIIGSVTGIAYDEFHPLTEEVSVC
ncbi:uroporphyrinogen-III C-methyltransferase [Thalassolituus sp. LLYu03]|uniref:uroporphyrinogen-III C-methyltransferase n=1 Tax=Thalassolituus sp. LLYu03 TaxID=3421656 RepID=UPI003D2CEC3C